MTLVSIQSLFFLIIILSIYYLIPSRRQWVVLLGASLFYYTMSVPFYTLIYLLVSVVTIYFATKWIEKKGKGFKAVYVVTLLINIGILVLLKYLNFVLGNVGTVLGLLGVKVDMPVIHLVASLGVSFYTLQMIGYLTDVYWGTSKAQNNIAKLALFSCYFPQMISGPISRYGQIKNDLFGEHKFDSANISKGFFRIIVGVFKKIVVAEHLLQPTEVLLSENSQYEGFFLWVGLGLYVVRIYADFAGCMDIVLGASECFGIALPENFKNPFGSKNIQEFWQRWHITLGTWLKDYIMYPILRTKSLGNLTKLLKNKVGKQTAKKLPTYLAMLVLWICMGIWHGGGWNFIVEGVWFWMVIVIGQLFSKHFEKLNILLKINRECWIWYFWQKSRTALIFAIGILFFKSNNVKSALVILKNALSIDNIVNSVCQIPSEILALDELLGTVKLLWIVGSILIGILGLILFSKIEKNGTTVADWWYKKEYWFKCFVIYILIISIIIFGAYGPGYSSVEFIYGGF